MLEVKQKCGTVLQKILFNLRDITRPASLIPEKADVIAYAQHLSYCQFTAQELKNGTAWKLLNS